MNRGKRKCELLLRMRARVAARYGLEYNPHECKHEEDCSGTCPLCDAELADLERQLQNRHITNYCCPIKVDLRNDIWLGC